MNKKLLELLDKINEKKLEVKNLAEQGKLEEAKAAKDELKNMQTQFDLLKDLDDTALAGAQNAMVSGTGVKPLEKKDEIDFDNLWPEITGGFSYPKISDNCW